MDFWNETETKCVPLPLFCRSFLFLPVRSPKKTPSSPCSITIRKKTLIIYISAFFNWKEEAEEQISHLLVSSCPFSLNKIPSRYAMIIKKENIAACIASFHDWKEEQTFHHLP
jgi:hypothetical protein